MNYIVKGSESEQRFEILLSLTKIKSEPIIKGLRYYYVNGIDESLIESMGVDIPNMRRAGKKLNEVAKQIEKAKELDWVNKRMQCVVCGEVCNG